jgi:hypothetical protein
MALLGCTEDSEREKLNALLRIRHTAFRGLGKQDKNGENKRQHLWRAHA